jgi:hypothetical protein
MALLFDRYRRLEEVRSEVLAGRSCRLALLSSAPVLCCYHPWGRPLPAPCGGADAAEKYGAAISRVFERVSGKAVSESVRALATHADFCKAVEEDAAMQVRS